MASSLLHREICSMCENKLALKEDKFSSMDFIYEKADALASIDLECETNFFTTCKNPESFLSPVKTKIGMDFNSNIIFYSSLSQSPELSKIIISSLDKSTSSNNNQSTSISSQ